MSTLTSIIKLGGITGAAGAKFIGKEKMKKHVV
jgi:hypothetical protein